MRKKISDSNTFPVFSVLSEYSKLEDLFAFRGAYKNNRGSSYSGNYLSIRDVLEECFLDWRLRGTFTSVEEMISSLQIRKADFIKDPSEDRLLDYIQFLINVSWFVEAASVSGKYSFRKEPSSIINAMLKNCTQLIHKLGAHVVKENGEFFIVYNDNIAESVADANEELRPSISEYLKIDNKGNLTRKEEILCSMSKILEPYEKQLIRGGFNSLCKDTTFLLNRSGIRHHLDPENKESKPFLEMTQEEREQCYDKAFQMLLACIAVIPYLDYKDEIKRLKK